MCCVMRSWYPADNWIWGVARILSEGPFPSSKHRFNPAVWQSCQPYDSVGNSNIWHSICHAANDQLMPRFDRQNALRAIASMPALEQLALPSSDPWQLKLEGKQVHASQHCDNDRNNRCTIHFLTCHVPEYICHCIVSADLLPPLLVMQWTAEMFSVLDGSHGFNPYGTVIMHEVCLS